jgi:cysteine desulfurase
MSKPVYLDYAASTPLDPQALKAMQPYFSEKFYNPSATYLAGRAVRNDLNEARATIANWQFLE